MGKRGRRVKIPSLVTKGCKKYRKEKCWWEILDTDHLEGITKFETNCREKRKSPKLKRITKGDRSSSGKSLQVLPKKLPYPTHKGSPEVLSTSLMILLNSRC